MNIKYEKEPFFSIQMFPKYFFMKTTQKIIQFRAVVWKRSNFVGKLYIIFQYWYRRIWGNIDEQNVVSRKVPYFLPNKEYETASMNYIHISEQKLNIYVRWNNNDMKTFRKYRKNINFGAKPMKKIYSCEFHNGIFIIFLGRTSKYSH